MKELAAAAIIVFSLAGAIPGALSYGNPARDEAVELMKAKEYDQALKKLATAVGLDATDAQNYVLRGKCFLKLGNYDLAIADLDKAVNYSPDDARAYFLRAIVNTKLGRNDSSVSDFEQAIYLNPKNASRNFDNASVRKNFEIALTRLRSSVRFKAKESESKDKLEPEDYLFNDVGD
ncbi:MAG: tetratricopeptide repeat protein [Candidatus Obscuribacterales bacterium]|nr:tetratricopeptide repeat protein [Candidatus Obscuribacterales bacterium]